MQQLDANQLRQLGQQQRSTACSCALRPTKCWESFTEDRWPKTQMELLGSLRDPDVYEATQEEFHPQGTRYGSTDAPVAVTFFPYNLCDVQRCNGCHKVLLRYTEFGGYYVDHRVRDLDPALVV
ncbi:MAG: hypothetical protein V4614_15970 [Pseudomonadota bacterium]